MTKKQSGFALNRTGALIAALPAILGFVPEKSLVLVAIDRGELGSVLRIDLAADLTDTLERFAAVAASARPDAAVAVIVDADSAHCPVCNDEHRELGTVLAEELMRHGIVLRGCYVVDRVAAGGRWYCADGCGIDGSVDDPSASPLAAAAVLEGRRLYPHRTDLEAVVAIEESPRSTAVAAVIAEHAALRATDLDFDPDGRARRDIEQVIAAIGRAAEGHQPGEAELASLGCTLTDVQVRDALFGLVIDECAAEAEAFWVLLARTLPAPWRAEALVLLAFSAYVRGDGPLAGVSLEGALQCAPAHRMARMLDTALQSGFRPEQIRELAESSYRVARRLGAQLPVRRGIDRQAG